VIKALRVRNFKSLADTSKLAIRPLTFLVGPNSAGKTSIIQSLLLLRQTVESRDLKNPLSINGPYVQLGSYPDLLFMHNPKARLRVEVEFATRYGGLLPATVTGGEPRRFDDIDMDVEFGYNRKTMQVFLEKCEFKILPQGNVLQATRMPGGKYQLQFYKENDLTAENTKLAADVEKFYAARLSYYTPSAATAAGLLRRAVASLSSQMAREVEELFRSVFYIGPLREFPKRIYIATGEAPQDVGLKGELSVDVLWVQARKKATRERLLGKVNKWMGEFGFALKVQLRRVGGNNYSVIFEDPNTGITVNLADVGFGASQVFPIVVEGFYARDRAMLLIEQPEIHLHPRAQAKLGDLLIDIALSGVGKTLLIETHSEHLLSRIRTRIAEGKVPRDSVAIYYCEPTSQGTAIRQISINDRGQYEGAGLPKNFFDEAYEEAAAQFKIQAEGS